MIQLFRRQGTFFWFHVIFLLCFVLAAACAQIPDRILACKLSLQVVFASLKTYYNRYDSLLWSGLTLYESCGIPCLLRVDQQLMNLVATLDFGAVNRRLYFPLDSCHSACAHSFHHCHGRLLLPWSLLSRYWFS